MAAQVYARAAKDREMIKLATDLRMEAERKTGEMLKRSAELGERHTKAKGRPNKCIAADTLIRLSDIGISRNTSSRWQKLAAMPQAEFEELKERVTKKAANALDGAAKRTRQEMRADDEARVSKLVPKPGRYRTLVIDPPCGGAGEMLKLSAERGERRLRSTATIKLADIGITKSTSSRGRAPHAN